MTRTILRAAAALVCAAGMHSAWAQASASRSGASAVEDTMAQRMQACTACHGQNGRGTTPEYPNIGGQHADYIAQALQLKGPDDLCLSLYRGQDGGLRFKLLRTGSEIALSDALPMLENLGLRVNSEHPYLIELDEGRVSIQDFEVEVLSGEPSSQLPPPDSRER